MYNAYMRDSLSCIDLLLPQIYLNEKVHLNKKTPQQRTAAIKVKLIHKCNKKAKEIGKCPYLFVLFRFCLHLLLY